jgi:GNAT superfamily N-acetyltransferase
MTTSSPNQGRPADPVTSVKIVERPYDHPDAIHLVRSLYEEQLSRYGFADPADADRGMYMPPAGLFLVAYVNGVPSACAGFRRFDTVGHVVEMKKMYTVPDHRRSGLGHVLLARLEERAARGGARQAILETGARSHAALALLRSAGYESTPCYVCGRDPAINRAFAKDLDIPIAKRGEGDLQAIA